MASSREANKCFEVEVQSHLGGISVLSLPQPGNQLEPRISRTSVPRAEQAQRDYGYTELIEAHAG